MKKLLELLLNIILSPIYLSLYEYEKIKRIDIFYVLLNRLPQVAYLVARYKPSKKDYFYLRYAAKQQDLKLFQIALKKGENLSHHTDRFLKEAFNSYKNYTCIEMHDDLDNNFLQKIKINKNHALLNYNKRFYSDVFNNIDVNENNKKSINMELISNLSTIYLYKDKDKYIDKNWNAYNDMVSLLKNYNLAWNEKDVFDNFYDVARSFRHFSQWKVFLPFMNESLHLVKDNENNNFLHYYLYYLSIYGDRLIEKDKEEKKYTGERFFNMIVKDVPDHYLVFSSTSAGMNTPSFKPNIIVENLYWEIDILWDKIMALNSFDKLINQTNSIGNTPLDIVQGELICYIKAKLLDKNLSNKKNIVYNNPSIRKI